MKLQKLLSYTRRAIDCYQMIDEGDKLAVGISGGKDSLTLLYALAELKKFYPKKFDVIAITVNLGFENFDTSDISELCRKLGVEYHVIDTEIYNIVFNIRKETNPCSLCAKMRKGALNDVVAQLGCNKIAYAHHKDDFIETFLMSLMYEGRIHTFSPKTYLDKSDLVVIRPLMYINEGEIISFKNAMQLPVIKSPCPADGYTKREYAKQTLARLEKETPGCKSRIFSAIERGELAGWPVKIDNPRLVK
jgi:tRNA(Ile)-lysidine synthetase-like protein